MKERGVISLKLQIPGWIPEVFACGLISALQFFVVQAQDEPLIIDDNAADSQFQCDPSLFFTTRTGSGIFENDIASLIPLATVGNGFVFTSLAYNFRDNGNSNFSGGLGFRFELPGINAVAGFRAHLDITETQLSHQVEQLGLGFDLFTASGIDIHGNLYLPNNESAFGVPVARRHSILQYEERGRRGGDAQVSAPVPFMDDIFSTRVFVGAYYYNPELTGNELSGVTAGVDVSPLCGVKLGVEYYDDEEFYGDNWVFKAGASVPIDNIFNPRDWGRSLSGIFQPRSQGPCANDIMASRICQPAPRRNWVTMDTRNKVLASNIVFVNNGGAVGNGIMAGSAGGIGTAENPVDTIQGGATALVSQLGGTGTVYVQAGTYASAADQNIEVGHGAGAGVTNAVFTSSLKPIAACAGYTFGGNTGRALIANGGFDIRGGSVGDTDTVQVQGFEIVGGITNNPPGVPLTPGDGIGLVEVANATINCNLIRGVNNGIAISPGAQSQHLIFDNTIRDNTGIGIHADGAFNGTIRANTIVNNGDHGIELETNNGTITANTISNNGGEGIEIQTLNGANGIISANTVTGNGGVGIQFFQSNNDGTVTGNTVSANGGNGIEFFQGDNNGVISANTISANGDNGIDFFQGAGNNGVISANTLSANGSDGIEFFQSNNQAGGTIDGNVATGNTADGFLFNNLNAGTFTNNVANNNGDRGYDGVGAGGVANFNNTGAGNTNGGNTP